MKETMTYNDFLSEVEKNKELMIRDGLLSSLRTNQLATLTTNTNRKLAFKDLEVGKIYVFWQFVNPLEEDKMINKTWFIIPTELKSPEDYSLYWCYYNKQGNLRKQSPSSEPAHHNNWSGYVWASKDWLRLDSLYPMKQIFINWNELPWSDLK